MIESGLQLRTVTTLISKQLRSTFPIILNTDERKEYVFSGDAQSIEFVTTYPLGYEQRSGLFHARYFIETSQSGDEVLKVIQGPIYKKNRHGEEDEAVTLLPGIRAAKWTFFF